MRPRVVMRMTMRVAVGKNTNYWDIDGGDKGEGEYESKAKGHGNDAHEGEG